MNGKEKGSMNALTLTNASVKNKRRKLDFYPTPPSVTHALMCFLKLPRDANVWEPACGDGAMAAVISSYGHRVYSTDIRKNTGYGFGGKNFLTAKFFGIFDAIITNPPFAESENFIRVSMQRAPVVAMLLKSQYFHAKKRTPLIEKFPPAWILPLNWRPDFLNGERGGSPTMDVLWAVWIEGQTDTRYRVLEKATE